MSIAFTFPGQGSQFIGMGQEIYQSFPVARSVFEEVDEYLGERLSEIIFNGPLEKLTLTANAQPALMTVSVAVAKVLEYKDVNLAKSVSFVAGHSMGEYSALVISGCLSLGDAAKLLRIRGESMQAAVPVEKGAMAAILGLDLKSVQEVTNNVANSGVCEVANDNADGQVVVSGEKNAVEEVIEIAKSHGAKRAVLLPVSAPFHCSLMAPAATRMQAALSDVTFKDPNIPLVSNVTAKSEISGQMIKENLVKQVTATVRWRESILFLESNGISTLVELGAGRVLTGLARRISPNLAGIAACTSDEINCLFKTVNLV